MKCPNCEETLVMTERQGVEIDYCPKCRGIWLDRGELDKIIERSGTAGAQDTSGRQEKEQKKKYREQDEDDEDDNGGFFGGKRRNNRDHEGGGFLSNLFDF